MTGLVVPGPTHPGGERGPRQPPPGRGAEGRRRPAHPARLVLSDPEGPLGLIEVDDPAFWKGLAPLPLAERVPGSGRGHRPPLAALGPARLLPGTVRQARAGRHGLSRASLLTLEVTSTMDGGGDSEVLVADGGGRPRHLQAGETSSPSWPRPCCASSWPTPRAGATAGFARAGIGWQDLTNPALRRLPRPATSDEGGVRLTRVLPHGSGAGVLKPGDVILEIAGHALDPTGQFDHPVYGRMALPPALHRRRAARRHPALEGAARRPAPRGGGALEAHAGGRRPDAALRLRPRARLRGGREASCSRS